MADPVADLIEALEPYAWVQVSPMARFPGLGIGKGWWVELRCQVKMPKDLQFDTGLDDAQIRRNLFLQAELLLATAKRRDWNLLRVPQIEFKGAFGPRGEDGTNRIIHECEVRLEMVLQST